jgi:hypothetical protein
MSVTWNRRFGTGYTVNGIDLDEIFEPLCDGVPTQIKTNMLAQDDGADLNTRYKHIRDCDNNKAAPTGFYARHNNTDYDLNELFCPIGCLQEVPVPVVHDIFPTTVAPTEAPTTQAPTEAPTTVAPLTAAPTEAPTSAPTEAPTAAPTTAAPTVAPTTVAPSAMVPQQNIHIWCEPNNDFDSSDDYNDVIDGVPKYRVPIPSGYGIATGTRITGEGYYDQIDPSFWEDSHVRFNIYWGDDVFYDNELDETDETMVFTSYTVIERSPPIAFSITTNMPRTDFLEFQVMGLSASGYMCHHVYITLDPFQVVRI